MSTEVLLCNRPFPRQAISSQFGWNIWNPSTSVNPQVESGVVTPYRPYLVGGDPSPQDQQILTMLSPAPVAQPLTELSLSYGEEKLFGLMRISEELRQAGISSTGISTAVVGNRVGQFSDSVRRYQYALLDYRNTPKPDRAAVRLAEQRVRAAFDNMQTRFRLELAHGVGAASRRPLRNPLLNPDRALNIARDSRHATKLDVMNQVEASRLTQFARGAKFLGGGAAVLDFGSGAANVARSFKANDDWHRDMFIESSSFAASAFVGGTTAKVGAGAIGFLAVATPVGWVGLVAAGLVVVGAAATTTIATNRMVRSNSGGIYDNIMRWLGGR